MNVKTYPRNTDGTWTCDCGIDNAMNRVYCLGCNGAPRAEQAPEHLATTRARFAVGKLNKALSELHVAQLAVERAQYEARDALLIMQSSGAPDEPWAAHWRMNLPEHLRAAFRRDV